MHLTGSSIAVQGVAHRVVPAYRARIMSCPMIHPSFNDHVDQELRAAAAVGLQAKSNKDGPGTDSARCDDS